MQLPGQKCWRCKQTISGRLEGRFCDGCGSPVHYRCESGPSDGQSNRCADCGADGETMSAWSDNRPVEEPLPQQCLEHVPPNPLVAAALYHILPLAVLAVALLVGLMVYLVIHMPIVAACVLLVSVSLVGFIRSYRNQPRPPDSDDADGLGG